MKGRDLGNCAVARVFVILVLALLCVAPSGAAAGDATERASVASDTSQGNGHSQYPSISADGRFVAFESQAGDLVDGDTNGTYDVFVHDRHTGDTTRVSVASDGTQGNGHSQYPSISADGRLVAFHSAARNLVTDDTNGTFDVFVHDRQAGDTARVSVTSDGAQAIGHSQYPSISSDGRYVAFHSSAANLVAGDTNGAYDVFVHDRDTGGTTRVSVASNGTQGNGHSQYPSISAQGAYVAFRSAAANLVEGDTNLRNDIFVRDGATNQTSRASIASGGEQGNDHSEYPCISDDGRFVAFESAARNLVTGDTNLREDIMVHDRQTGQTTRVSVASDGTQGNGISASASISAAGRFVAFSSAATNLIDGDTNVREDVFVRDRLVGRTIRVSVASDGAAGNGSSQYPAINAAGRFVAFSSVAANLIDGDTNLKEDVFVRDRLPGDANGDCSVNILDMIFIRNRLNKSTASDDNWQADVTQDNKIDILDMIFVRNRINMTCE